MSTNSEKDGSTGFRSTGPSPFANQPPLGLNLLAKDDPQDVLPDWPKIAPHLPQDCYSVADALWWARKLQEPAARADDLAYMLRNAADSHAVHKALGIARSWWPSEGTPRFWKSGGPSRSAALNHLPLPVAGIQQLDAATAASAPTTIFNMRGIEGEIALRIKQNITAAEAAALTPETAPAVVDAYAVAIEWVDSRWREGTQAPALTLFADAQSHGGLALSPWQDFAPLRQHDWSQQKCTLQVNDTIASTFVGTHSLQNPTWLLAAWLQFATTQYGTVQAGTVVTTGTWTGCPCVQAGDLVTVNFDGLGQVRWQF